MTQKEVSKHEKEIKNEYTINQILARQLEGVSASKSPTLTIMAIDRARKELAVAEDNGFKSITAPIAKRVMDLCEDLDAFVADRNYSGKEDLMLASKAAAEGLAIAERYDSTRSKKFAALMGKTMNKVLSSQEGGSVPRWEDITTIKRGLNLFEKYGEAADSKRFASILVEMYGKYIKENQGRKITETNSINASLSALGLARKYKLEEGEKEIMELLESIREAQA